MRLNELPHISHVPLDGRAVLLQPFFDGIDWHSYLETEHGDLVRALPGSMEAGVYYAAAPATPTDLHFPFGTLIAQHLSFPDVATHFYALVEDIHLLAASLEKLELLAGTRRDYRGLTFLVDSEVEYLFVLVRAMYDVLQSVVRAIARLLSTQEGRHVVQDLPTSFADMVKGDPPDYRSAEELRDRYGLPLDLGRCYAAEAERFNRIRSIRVGIEHFGRRLPSVYATERGFAIDTKARGAWSSLEVWQKHELLPNALGSVRALAAFLAQSVLQTFTRFEQALRRTIHPSLLPHPVFAGKEIYVTNPCIGRLTHLDRILESPWTTL